MQNNTERDIDLDLMLKAAKKLEEFCSGYNFETFLTDSKTQSHEYFQLDLKQVWDTAQNYRHHTT